MTGPSSNDICNNQTLSSQESKIPKVEIKLPSTSNEFQTDNKNRISQDESDPHSSTNVTRIKKKRMIETSVVPIPVKKTTKMKKVSKSRKNSDKHTRTKSNEEANATESMNTNEEFMTYSEYQQLLSELFPSKHQNKKLQKQIEDNDTKSKTKSYKKRTSKKDDSDKDGNIEGSQKSDIVGSNTKKEQPMNIVFQIKDIQDLCNKRMKKKRRLNKKKYESDDDDENDDSDDDDDTYDDEDSDDDDEEDSEEDSDEDSEEDSEEDSDEDDEEEDEGDDSDEDDEEEDEGDDSDEEDDEEDDEDDEDDDGIEYVLSSKGWKKTKGSRGRKRRRSKRLQKNKSEDIDTKKEGENKEILNKLCSFSNELLKLNKDNKLAQEMVKITENKKKMNERKIMKRDKKTKEANWLKFKKMIREKSATKDSTYFKEKMTLEEQNATLNKMKEITELVKIDKPFRIGLYDLDIPNEFKAIALKKIDMLKYMDWGSGEYYKVKTWVDTFMRIPFNRLNTLSIKKEDGFDKCSEFMHHAKQQLDEVVYGLADAKMQVLQLIGQWITNPSAVGTAIAIKGPMGSGKTTLIKNGISKILGREFAFIALGGATDSAFLEGHSITYEGSTWGKIVDILIQCRSMNPIIYFDELDKISETPKGEEITGILTHLTDVTQNDKFHDKFFSEIDFDLSKCLFIFSYNDESKVNPILRDRMYRISTKGYDKNDKCKIANDYLLPKIREQLKFEKGDIIIDDSVLHYIIDNYTQNEDGVRNLKRCLEIIHTKVNLFTMLKPDTKLYEDDITLQITFPYMVTNQIVEKLIKKEQNTGSPFGMYL